MGQTTGEGLSNLMAARDGDDGLTRTASYRNRSWRLIIVTIKWERRVAKTSARRVK